MRIIFVCQGNIIRSPLAENMFRYLARERGVGEKYQLDSAGTSAYHVGEPPDHRMRQVADNNGFEYTGRAKQFRVEDFDQFELVIAMDKANQRYLEMKALPGEQRSKIHLMREYDPEGKPGLDVPDPYYGGLDGFEVTFEIVKRSCQGLMEALESETSTP
ncbi:MAG: low molecular weight phosphotyrosine protein phosphatase [Anaerolineales bacterium]|nr:low molecular weight phosphotyrosine protein phosphatase [Anaerolineales bacterium]